MTMQISDSILIEGEYFGLGVTLPVPDRHPAICGRDPRQHPLPRNSANWRGYTATWAIIDSRLYLTKLSGKYTLASESPVFTDWVSSKIPLSLGRPSPELSSQYTTIPEAYLLLEIEQGNATRWQIEKSHAYTRRKKPETPWIKGFVWPDILQAILDGGYRESAKAYDEECEWKNKWKIPSRLNQICLKNGFATWANLLDTTGIDATKPEDAQLVVGIAERCRKHGFELRRT